MVELNHQDTKTPRKPIIVGKENHQGTKTQRKEKIVEAAHLSD